MANTDNTCKDLIVNDVYNNSKNTLDDLYMLQKNIQEKVYNYNFEDLRSKPISELKNFFQWNMWALSDEMHETMDALGGIKDGIGNAVWKPWKKDHQKINTLTFNDLSEDDKKELKMELIDMQHFIFNMMHAVGLTTEELMNFYYSKNEENVRRQNNNY